ncbi:MAG: DNA polymerase III subunit delta', partial [Cyanobacteria bacterium K_DeepCast_35m_m2_023]|nr:DNA polymerase III subunit delta' [Cyanobacteria bacterium K_DeepCast_35m_m2_023]
VRELTRFLARRAVEAPGCLVVLEAAEAMAEAAANALLKTLEEPGDGLLVLITAAPDQLLSTIRSRCQTIPFKRLAPDALQQVLRRCGDPAASAAAAPDPPVLLELAAGSPGALLEHRQQWQQLPVELRELAAQCLGTPQALRGCEPLQLLDLARQISETLDGEQQLWLLQWWQLVLWRGGGRPAMLERLERLRHQLLAYVQPRLAWEVALLDLAKNARSATD